MLDVSVIVPVCNAGEYLKPCLESISAQTLRSFECICVENGSTDGSGAVLAEHAAKDPRFKVLDIGKAGAAAARNRGIDAAVGRYLMFLDADDLFVPQMLEKLFARAESSGADIVFCRHQIYETDKKTLRDCIGVAFPEIDPHVRYPFRTVKDLPLQAYSPCPWNKFFRADFVRREGLRFQPIPSANDTYFTSVAKIAARSCATVPDVLVHYRTGQSSNITAKVHKDPSCVVRALSAIWEETVRRGLDMSLSDRFTEFSGPNLLYTVKLVRDDRDAFVKYLDFLRASPIVRFLDAKSRASLIKTIVERIPETDARRADLIEAFDRLPSAEVLTCARRHLARFAEGGETLGGAALAAVGDNVPKVSVVITAFNKEDVIEKTVGSVLAQSLKEIEVVCVDDGSADGTWAKICACAREDGRVVPVRHVQNLGTHMARKTGALRATGDYITFLDGDDRLLPRGCEEAYACAVREKADIVHCGVEIVNLQNFPPSRLAWVEKPLTPYDQTVEGVEILKKMCVDSAIGMNVCGKLLDRKLVQDAVLRLPDVRLVMAEDIMLGFVIGTKAKRYVPAKDVKLYSYSYGGGITGRARVDLAHWQKMCKGLDVLGPVRQFRDAGGSWHPAVWAAYVAFKDRLVRENYNRIWRYLETAEDRRAALTHLKSKMGDLDFVSHFAFRNLTDPSTFLSQLDSVGFVPKIVPSRISRVAFVYRHLSTGGIQRVMLLLAPVFRSLGCEVIFVLDKKPDEQSFRPPEGVKLVFMDSRYENAKAVVVGKRLAGLAKIIREEKVDLVYYHRYSTSLMPWDLLTCKLVCKVPFVLHYHSCVGTCLYTNAQTPDFANIAYRLRMCDHVIALSRTDELFLRAQGVRATYLLNPIDPKLVAAAEKKIDKDKRFAGQNILWCGRISSEKNPLEAIEIFEGLHRRLPKTTLTIVGDGDAAIVARMKRRISEYRLEKFVTLVGNQVDTYPFYAQASVFLMTSAYEGFGMTLAEAGCHGLPIVMYALPFLSTTKDNPGVVQVPQGDRVVAVCQLECLLTDRPTYDATAEASKRSSLAFADFDQRAAWQHVLASLQKPDAVNEAKAVDLEEVRLLLDELTYCFANGVFKFKMDRIRRLEKELSLLKVPANPEESPLLRKKVDALSREVCSLKTSQSYRVGLFVTWPLRRLYRLLRRT